MRKYYKIIKRVTITGPMKEKDEAAEWCGKNGFYIVRYGPKPIGNFKVDPNTFFIKAEKEIEE